MNSSNSAEPAASILFSVRYAWILSALWWYYLLSSSLDVSEFPWHPSIHLPENTWPPRRRVAPVMSSKPLTRCRRVISVERYLGALIKRGQNAPIAIALFFPVICRSTRLRVDMPPVLGRFKIVKLYFCFIHVFWPVTLLAPYVCFFLFVFHELWSMLMHHSYCRPTSDDHKPKVGMRVPGRLNHKHVWIYLSKLEFISCSLARCVSVGCCGGCPFSRLHLKWLGAYWEAIESCEVKVVRFFSHPRPSLPETRVVPAGTACFGCMSLNPHSVVWGGWRWRWLAHYLVKNKAVLLAGFLWYWCAHDPPPPLPPAAWSCGFDDCWASKRSDEAIYLLLVVLYFCFHLPPKSVISSLWLWNSASTESGYISFLSEFLQVHFQVTPLH